MAQQRMLAWQLCDFSGDQDKYCYETLYFCDFSGGGGGVEPPVLPSGFAHDMPHTGTACVNNIVTDQPVPGGAV